MGSATPAEISLRANGLRFAALALGDGPLALCLHGFPDTAHGFRHLLPALAAAGYRAVAPFTRGYAPTALAPDGDYGLEALAADANALHAALGGDERAVLIGHDWGAETAYVAATREPDRWSRVVSLAIPPLTLDPRLMADPGQVERFYYLFLLAEPGATAMVAAGELAFLDRLWREWSPGYDASEDLAHVRESLRAPEHLDAALAYYRAAPPAGSPVPPHPVLYLHGERDGCIDVELCRDAETELSAGSAMRAVPGAGHFLHLERPELVDALIVDWLTGDATDPS